MEKSLSVYQARYRALIEHFGSQSRTSKELGVSQSCVSDWSRGVSKMSLRMAFCAEKKTNRKFKASELCPDLNEEIVNQSFQPS